MGKYYKNMFSWLKTNPKMINEADSEDYLFRAYEEETGDDSYRKDNEKVISADVFKTKPSKTVPYNVIYNKQANAPKKTSAESKTVNKSKTSSKSKSELSATEKEKRKYCPECGAKYNDPEAKFCSQCGKKIAK